MKVTERFSDRVENYIKYRPNYPIELFNYLQQQIPDCSSKICADFGSGTGILSKHLVKMFKKVITVEPNEQMRQAAEIELQAETNFISLNSSAENSEIESNSIDLLTAAQAFHWFDRTKFKVECQRILNETGRVALIWNNRLNNTKFLQKYDQLLYQYATDYQEVNHQNISESDFADFFSDDYQKIEFENHQEFDLEELFGRLDSSSYAPKVGTNEFNILREQLSLEFKTYAQNGKIRFNYQCQLYFGKIT